jgi:hypothetical protein
VVVPHATVAALVSLCLSAASAGQQASHPLPSRPIEISATLPPVVLSTDQLVTLERWSREYEAWAVWFGQWRNRPEPGWLAAKPRRQPPAPPVWLPSACTDVLDDGGTLVNACHDFQDWLNGDSEATRARQQIALERAEREKPQKTIWWEHIHVDALWPMTQSGVSAFGVFGTHATTQVTKRFQVFLAPGIILMRLPSADGGQQWNAATDWGFSYRLTDLKLPRMHRPSALHLNIARVWVFGVNNLPITGSMYLAGFSLTFQKTR